MGWMACHFSPYGTGLSNCPSELPDGSLLIVNDRTPVCGHDPDRIARQLSQLAADTHCAGILLDLQRPDVTETANIVRSICAAAPCPVAVSEHYCCEGNCAVFLTPPLHTPLKAFLSPWQDREIWLEAAMESAAYVVTERGCALSPLPCPPTEFPHNAEGAFSRYHIAVENDAIRFSFRRSKEELLQMAQDAENVRCMVGLYQQLK